MRKTHTLGMVLVAGLALAGCGGAAEGSAFDASEQACDEFAAYSKASMPTDTRVEVVSSMGEVIGNADQSLQDGYEVLTNAVDSPESTWTVAADTFATACFDTGWES